MYSYTHRQANDKEVLLTVVKAVSLGIFLYGFFSLGEGHSVSNIFLKL